MVGNAFAVFTIDFGNVVFSFALLLGLVFLLVTVVLDDVFSGLFDAMHVDIDVNGVQVAPIVMGFVAMFGIGGLFGTQVFGLDSGKASIVGAAFGAGGAGLVYLMFNMLTRGQSPDAYSVHDLVGVTGRVVVGIPKGRYGEVLLTFGGTTQKRMATSDVDVAAGSMVTVTGVAGSAVIVEPVTASASTPA